LKLALLVINTHVRKNQNYNMKFCALFSYFRWPLNLHHSLLQLTIAIHAL
jgi:hypothetical protein